MSDWISVDKRLPEPGKKILMFGDGDMVEAGYYDPIRKYPWVFFEVGGYVVCQRCFDEISLEFTDNGWKPGGVTYWSYYPDPPQEEAE